MAPTPATSQPRSSLFAEWLGDRDQPSLGTNGGRAPLAFQSWHRFKEAFAPELVYRAIAESPIPVSSCLEPFGGSGTTALTAQFLGVPSTTVEVNPFLADVIRAKLSMYNVDDLSTAIVELREAVRTSDVTLELWNYLPPTFIEPGVNTRWLFDSAIAIRIARLVAAIHLVDDEATKRLFRVLLGGILVEVSNVVVSGKGRRYRRNWQERRRSPVDVDRLFFSRALTALSDIHRYSGRPDVPGVVITGDAREVSLGDEHDLMVCSPPYPNSFDYTDVYNLELWLLGYLTVPTDNAALRRSTLSSHVQLQRAYASPPAHSATLERVIHELDAARPSLWSPWLPDMVGAYFADLLRVLRRVRTHLRPASTAWIVVGDSRYAGIPVPTSLILTELASADGWEIAHLEPFRAMKSSAQQGHREIDETLVVLQRC
jgi:hypothetical protein